MKTPDSAATPCGACVLVAQELIFQAKNLIHEAGEPTPEWPEAVEQLRGSGVRWKEFWDLDDFESALYKIGYRYPWFETGHDEGFDVSQQQSREGAK